MRFADAKRGPTPRTAREAKKSKRELKADRQRTRERFARARKAETQYAIRLRQIARSIGHMVSGILGRKGIVAEANDQIQAALHQYAGVIGPWARATAARMIADVSRRDEMAWREYARELGGALQEEIDTAPTGETMRKLMALQVDLITSLPTEAAKRVHKLVLEGMQGSRRSSEVAAEILRTGHVTESRATLIARTETARASTMLTMARALHIGSEAYVWRTARDGNVRDTHKHMEGKIVRWDTPPKTDKHLEPYHAGAGPNCRCYPEPIIPDDL